MQKITITIEQAILFERLILSGSTIQPQFNIDTLDQLQTKLNRRPCKQQSKK